MANSSQPGERETPLLPCSTPLQHAIHKLDRTAFQSNAARHHCYLPRATTRRPLGRHIVVIGHGSIHSVSGYSPHSPASEMKDIQCAWIVHNLAEPALLANPSRSYSNSFVLLPPALLLACWGQELVLCATYLFGCTCRGRNICLDSCACGLLFFVSGLLEFAGGQERRITQTKVTNAHVI